MRFSILMAALLLALAGCGRSFLQSGERAPWRQQAELACLKAGKVKISTAVSQAKPIEGPGMCGADFPLKVAALGSGDGDAIGYAEEVRPPGAVPRGAMPNFPPSPARYAPVARAETIPLESAPVQRGNMRWETGPQPIAPVQSEPAYRAPSGAGQPMSIRAPGVAQPDDIPDDAVLPDDEAPRTQPATAAPSYAPSREQRYERQEYRELPRLGPARGATAPAPKAVLTPSATLACPIVSALDRWVADGVQPAAIRWFGSPVAEIKQISAYSCRGMVGSGTSSISEHAFGNALDIAGFTLADGRKISVMNGWRGTPEEQGFLHDVQLAACDTFNTVLAPGYNAAHYNHIHVDLMRRASGRKPCRPAAIPGEEVAARARAVYASRGKGGRDVTGSIKQPITIGGLIRSLPEAKAGEDGYVADEDGDDTTGSIPDAAPAPAPSKGGWFSGLFGGGKNASAPSSGASSINDRSTKNY